MNRKKALLIVVLLFAIVNTGKWALHFIRTDYHPLDFRTYYVSSSTYWQNSNPYSVQQNQLNWAKMNSESSWGIIEFPHSIPVYAPQFVSYFFVFNLFHFNTAAIFQFFLNIFSLLAICILVLKLNKDIKPMLAIAMILAFRGTWYALDNGQPMLQILALSLYAFYLFEYKQKKILAGIILGCLAFKFTLIIPFAVYFIAGKQYKTFFTLAITSLALNAICIAAYSEPSKLLFQWIENVNALYAYPHSAHSINALGSISTSISIPMYYFFDLSIQGLKTSMLMMYLLGLIAASFLKSNMHKYYPLFAASLCSLCFGQHLMYDILSLLVYRLIIYKEIEKQSYFEYFLLLFLFLPIGGIADFTEIQVLHLILPLLLFIYFLTRISDYFLIKKIAMKNPN